MKLRHLMLFSVAFLSLAVTGCNNRNTESEPEDPRANLDTPIAFVLTGQSNMEGNTQFTKANLKKVFTQVDIAEEDGQCCFDGIEEVQTSYYGCGYGQIYTNSNIHASNTKNKIAGKFLATKTGMGNSSNSIGPELGAAYVLKQNLNPNGQKVYFIKCGISGSGFAQDDSQGDKINWNVEKEQNLYVNHLKPYTQNCLDLIEQETGKKPIIKAFLWNQGESDADEKKIPYYNDRFDALVGKFKADFGSYAPEANGEKIAVIDALIYEKGKTLTQQLTDEKLKNIARHDNYYYVDATQREGGLKLTMGGDNLHYDLKSIFRLGMAYGQAIVDHNLLK